MSEPIEITLAGDTLTAYELPVAKLQSWRQLARPIVDAQDGVIEELRAGTEAGDAKRIKEANQQFEKLIDTHLVLMLDLVLDWLPDQQKRDHYGERATTDEVLEAFFPLARIAYRSSVDFFLAMWQEVSIHGSPGNPTGTSSPDLSGESGTTN